MHILPSFARLILSGWVQRVIQFGQVRRVLLETGDFINSRLANFPQCRVVGLECIVPFGDQWMMIEFVTDCFERQSASYQGDVSNSHIIAGHVLGACGFQVRFKRIQAKFNLHLSHFASWIIKENRSHLNRQSVMKHPRLCRKTLDHTAYWLM